MALTVGKSAASPEGMLDPLPPLITGMGQTHPEVVQSPLRVLFLALFRTQTTPRIMGKPVSAGISRINLCA